MSAAVKLKSVYPSGFPSSSQFFNVTLDSISGNEFTSISNDTSVKHVVSKLFEIRT